MSGEASRDVVVTPPTALAHGEAHVRGSTKSDERVPSGRRAVEARFGDDFHRDSGTWRGFNYTVDRKNDRYRKRLTTADGKVVVDEPLSEHLGHSSNTDVPRGGWTGEDAKEQPFAGRPRKQPGPVRHLKDV